MKLHLSLNMKHDTEIRISELISSFFEGTTSPIEEAELEKLINEADSIPASLRNDCEAFLLCRSASNVEIPAGLLERLETAIDNKAKCEIATKAKPRRRLRLIVAFAAAAAVVIAFLIPAVLPNHQQIPADSTILAQNSPQHNEKERSQQTAGNKPTIKTEILPSKQNEPIAQTVKTTTVVKHPVAPSDIKQTRIVEDPQEAAFYIAKALATLGKSKQTADTRLSDCNRQIGRATRLLNAVSSRINSDETNPA